MVWQRVLEWARFLFRQKELTEKNTADIKVLQSSSETLADTVQALAFDFTSLRNNEARERENLVLRIENMLLRERSLPPGPANSKSANEELRRQIEGLKRENEELRKRLEQRELE